jgi:thiamine pyrophosphokinase
VIAADGGTLLAERLGLTPHLIVGDVDSSPAELVTRFEQEGIAVRRYEHSTKWETDTELALMAALEWQPGVIYVLGGIGGRLDHSLANVFLLTNLQLAGKNVRILDGRHELFLAKPGGWNAIAGNRGSIVTLLPVGIDTTGVVTRGLHWPLNLETLPKGQGRGVSNLIEDPQSAAVRYETGQLLVAIVHA